MTISKPRRQFLKTTVAASLTGSFPLPVAMACNAVGVVAPIEEPLYLGRSMQYWLNKLVCNTYSPIELDVKESDLFLFLSLGQAAVPGLIEAMRHSHSVTPTLFWLMDFGPTTIRALTDALEHEHPNVRIVAAKSLLRYARYDSSPEHTEPLQEAFLGLARLIKREPRKRVVYETAYYLSQFSLRSDCTITFPVNVADWGGFYAWATAALACPNRFRPDQVVPLLIPRLTDSNPAIRLVAAEALSAFQPDHPGIVPAYVEYVVHRKKFSPVMFLHTDRFIDKALPAIHEAFRRGSTRQRAGILHAVAWTESRAVLSMLAEATQDDAEEVRIRATRYLSCHTDPAVTPLLVRGLRDHSQAVRHAARWGLRHDDRPHLTSAMPLLIQMLEQGEPADRLSAALAVYRLHKNGRAALPSLRRNLEHDAPDVRLGAALAIARWEDNGSEYVHILVSGIDHPENDVREAAIEELARTGLAARAVLPQIMAEIENGRTHETRHWCQARLLRLLARLGPEAAPALPLLIKLLGDSEMVSKAAGEIDPHAIRSALEESFAGIGPLAIRPLVKVIREGGLLASRRAVAALGRMGPLACCEVSLLVDLLQHGNPAMRVTAAEALGRIGPSAAPALPRLRQLAEDRDLLLRKRARSALLRIGGLREIRWVN